ncbi:MAG: queuosine precursor transporter [Prevotellaceae bacterium]|jgi:uncharacterized integral membrane protein (TIGR00697 family)|nr:queuosine precursor transporter [Prevotellaceae bacterium]
MKKLFSVSFVLLSIVFNVCLIVSNILEVKLIAIGPIMATAGLLVFPVSYVINDCIVEVWGYRKACLVIWTGFAMNFFTVGLLQLGSVLPAAPEWDGQAAYLRIFSATPRIAAASFLAFLTGSFLNAYVMSRMKVRSQGKHFSWRAIASTLVGESVDSLIFFPLAFGGVVSLPALLTLIATQACMKTAYEIIALPLTTRVVKYIKRIDQTDVYDKKESYNPLKIRKR